MEESLPDKHDTTDRLGIAQTWNNLGSIAYAQKDFVAAEAYYKESLAIKQGLGDKSGTANTLSNLSAVARERRDLGLALAYLQESLILRQEMQDRHGQAISLVSLAQMLSDGQPLHAVRFFAAVETLLTAYGIQPPPATRQGIEDFLAKVRAGNPGFQTAWDKGHILSPEAAVDEALRFCSEYSATPTDDLLTSTSPHE